MMMKKVLLLALSILMVACLMACSKKEETITERANYKTLEDFDGARFAILTGSIYDKEIPKVFPNAEISYYSAYGDSIAAVAEGKADAVMCDTLRAKDMISSNQNITCFGETLPSLDYAFALAKNDRGTKLLEELNLYIDNIKANGKLNTIITKWTVYDEQTKFDYQSLQNINGEVVLAADPAAYPFCYIYEGEMAGLDIDIIGGFCKENGYSLKIDQYDFAGTIAAVSSGKADMVGSSIMITEERAEKMNFTIPFLNGTASIIFRKSDSSSKYNNLYELAGKKIGCLDGGMADVCVVENIKDAQPDYYFSVSDMLLAVEQDKIEAFSCSSTTIDCLLAAGKPIKVVGDVYNEKHGFMFNKEDTNIELLNQINTFIDEKQADGTFNQIYTKWCDTEADDLIDYNLLTGENGTVKMAVCSSVGEPHCYFRNDQIVGFDMEIMYLFCKQHGYKLEITDYSFAGMLAAVAANKVDLAGSAIAITPEREQTTVFSTPYKTAAINIVVSDEGVENTKTTFLQNIKNSFERTFIRENRYKLFISGIDATINITLLSVLFGTILGFLLFVLYRLNNPIISYLLKIYTWLINGMPTVVILMVFFYIIFSNSTLESKTIAILAFTVIFSVTVFGLLKICFASISKGQYEAAYALGYGKAQTLFEIIIPQIAPTFLPNYRSEIISLMKATSIVGYIAVQDLTKMSDVVRSRTYEAFFPIIASTILYFLIAEIFIIAINLINKKIDTKSRKNKDILKGVNVHD